MLVLNIFSFAYNVFKHFIYMIVWFKVKDDILGFFLQILLIHQGQ